MESHIKVSVVVSVYNTERYIKRCIGSVLSQTLKDIELLLVDDGSTDESPFICDGFSRQDSRVRVIHQENKGCSEARNYGIRNAHGRYIAFLDSDDWWDERFLESMLKGQESADLCICKLCKVNLSGEVLQDEGYCCDQEEWCWPILHNFSISCSRCLFLRDVVIENGIFFMAARKKGEDQEFTYKYMMHVSKINYVPEACYYYQLNPASSMFKKDYSHFDAVEAMRAVEQYAELHCSVDKAALIHSSMCNYKYPYLLEFGILTMLTAGEAPKNLCKYLIEKGYYVLLDNACHAPRHYNSRFMQLWGVSPFLCLRVFWLRKNIGRRIRKLKFVCL